MDRDYTNRIQCSLCLSPLLKTVLDLGSTSLANEYLKPSELAAQQIFPLAVVMCERCGHAQTSIIVAPERLFGAYNYATSTSKVTLDHLREEVATISRFYEEQTGEVVGEKTSVLEIGSNDGAMLDVWKKVGAGRVFGVDPAASRLKAYDVQTTDGFFDLAFARKLSETYDIVVANNVFAHVPSVKEGGLFVFEVSYLLDMAGDSPAFDTIYHEHTSYHSLQPLAAMLDQLGMPIQAAARLYGQVGRGSLRVIARKGPGTSMTSTSARKLMFEESKTCLSSEIFWQRLLTAMNETIEATGSWVERLVSCGLKVAGYGAAAKLTTLMNLLGLSEEHIAYVCDDSTWKQGLCTPGTHIPIRSPEVLTTSEAPDTCLIFAWNFADSIMKANQKYEGRWLVPLPKLQEF
jgi:hypothetical protein